MTLMATWRATPSFARYPMPWWMRFAARTWWPATAAMSSWSSYLPHGPPRPPLSRSGSRMASHGTVSWPAASCCRSRASASGSPRFPATGLAPKSCWPRRTPRSTGRSEKPVSLAEDLLQLVQLAGDLLGLRDHVAKGDDGDLPVLPDRDHPRLFLGQQVGCRHAQTRGPDAIDGRRRPATLQVPQHGHPRLEAGRLLDPGAERIAHPLLSKLEMTERVALLRCGRHRHRRLERAHPYPFGHHDDAGGFPLGAPPVQVIDDSLELRLELRNDDHVSAPRQATDHRHPAGITPHYLNHHDAMMGRGGGVEPIESLDHDANGGIEADAELGHR